MKVLQLIPSLENRAPVNLAIDLAVALRLIGIDVDICYVKNTHSRSLPDGIKSFPLTLKTIIDGEYDIVHSHMIKPNILSLFFRRSKLVSTIHSDMWFDISESYGKIKSKFITFLWITALKRFDMNCCLSDYHAKLYGDRLKSLTVVPNGIAAMSAGEAKIDGCIQKKIRSFYSKGNTVFSVASFRKLKGLEQIISLLEIDTDKKCVFFGDGPDSELLKDMAYNNGVRDRCLFLGFVNNPYLYFDLCDALLIVSRSEGFPLSLLEGVRCEAAVVCSNIPAFDGLFDNELYKYNLDDISSLKQTLRLAIQDVDKKSKLLTMFLQKYTIDDIAKKYSDVYKVYK